ncbi:CBS domain-containing protein [Sorangium sp. So ce117]|uniref:CBS domain-containing protein n=1 Tax=Sorangium sp. So ce117 TaxID=3133277 RepID=UPI003F5EFF4D
MADQGFTDRQPTGDLRDVITRRHSERAIVTVQRGDALLVAYARMKLYDVSQLPVLEDGKIVGLLDESDLLLAAVDDASRFQQPVETAMTTRLRTVDVRTPIRDLLPMFDAGLVPIVTDGDEFVGLVTRIDLINHLRRRVKLHEV